MYEDSWKNVYQVALLICHTQKVLCVHATIKIFTFKFMKPQDVTQCQIWGDKHLNMISFVATNNLKRCADMCFES